MKRAFALAILTLACANASPAAADQLYRGGSFAGLASDNRAQGIGDILTVVIFESATATNRVRTRSGKSTDIGGSISVGSIDERAGLSLRGNYTGGGDTERSERFVATMAGTVVDILPNGDFLIEGRQQLLINGEARNIAIRGQVRQLDISADNTVLSSRLASARIDYDGKGFVSRSARPGLVNRIFNFLGLS